MDRFVKTKYIYSQLSPLYKEISYTISCSRRQMTLVVGLNIIQLSCYQLLLPSVACFHFVAGLLLLCRYEIQRRRISFADTRSRRACYLHYICGGALDLQCVGLPADTWMMMMIPPISLHTVQFSKCLRRFIIVTDICTTTISFILTLGVCKPCFCC